MTRTSVLLPTLDEAPNIIPLIDAIKKHTPDLHEVLVLDDDSKDGTPQLVEEYSRQPSAVPTRLIRRTQNPGLTPSLQEGIERSTGDIVVWMDCDFSMPPELIADLVNLVKTRCDIAVGSRFVDGGSFKRDTEGTQDSWLAVALSRLMNYTIQILLAQGFKDYTSGFIAVRRAVLDRIQLTGNYGEYFIDLIFRAKKLGFSAIEIPYICVPRLQGYSKTGQGLGDYLRRGSKYIVVALRLRFLSFIPGFSFATR